VDAYLAELHALVAEVTELLEPVPAERRVLVTNHDVLGAFAERFGFEVLGVIVPGGSTLAEPSAAELAALAEAVREAGVPAVFADATAPARLAEALADERRGVAGVELFTGSLGEPGSGAATYLGMVRTNAARIAAPLTPGPAPTLAARPRRLADRPLRSPVHAARPPGRAPGRGGVVGGGHLGGDAGPHVPRRRPRPRRDPRHGSRRALGVRPHDRRAGHRRGDGGRHHVREPPGPALRGHRGGAPVRVDARPRRVYSLVAPHVNHILVTPALRRL